MDIPASTRISGNNNALSRFGIINFGLFFAVGVSQSGFAAEWDLGVSLGLSHTDNIFLESENVTDELTYRVIPTIQFDHQSPTLDATLDYEMDWYRYADIGDSSDFHRLDSSAQAKFLDERFTIGAGVSRQPVIRDPGESTPAFRLFFNENFADRDRWFVRPAIQETFGSAVSLSASYEYSENDFNDELIQDDQSSRSEFAIENYRQGRGLTWALRHTWREVRYEVSSPWSHQIASAELGFWINQKARFFAAGGKESPWDDPANTSLEDEFWEAGFAYENGERLRAEFAVGEREFGDSWRGMLEASARRSSFSVSYEEAPSTIGLEEDDSRNLFLDTRSSDDYLSRLGTAERYISEQLLVSASFEGRRTSLEVAIFDENRAERFSALGSPLDDNSQRGGELRIGFDAGSRTTISLSGRYANRVLDESLETDFLLATIEGEFSLTANTSITLTFDHTSETPDSDVALFDYTANVISLFLNLSL